MSASRPPERARGSAVADGPGRDPGPEPAALAEADLGGYLERRGLLPRGATVTVTAAGDGNINWVRRVRARDGRSWIVKQARARLERFPEYQAPTERIACEARWLAIASAVDEEGLCPRVHDFDEAGRVLVLEDLGDAERLDRTLARGGPVERTVAAVARLLGRVHRATERTGPAERFANEEMRRLHGDHIFHLPLRPNDFPLPAPLRARARELWRDRELVGAADRAYARYLESAACLVHADPQPGNVLLAARGPVLLDAEISHWGDPAFDVGVLLAHVLLAGVMRRERRRAARTAAAIWEAYDAAAPGAVAFPDAARYAGLEMLRRTIGAARSPLLEGRDDAAAAALERARALVCAPPAGPGEERLA